MFQGLNLEMTHITTILLGITNGHFELCGGLEMALLACKLWDHLGLYSLEKGGTEFGEQLIVSTLPVIYTTHLCPE